MRAWLESLAGPEYASALMWTVLALVGLLVVLVIVRIVRGLTFGTFVAGGRNRKTRLAVMDATAVDSQRRLVLVRRDDVEHLILIGGPSDVVVEQNIRLSQPSRRPAEIDRAERQSDEPVAPAPAEPQKALPPRPAYTPPPPRSSAFARSQPTNFPAAAPRPAPASAEPVSASAPSFVRPAPEPRAAAPASPPVAQAPRKEPDFSSFTPRSAAPAPMPAAPKTEPEKHDLDEALLEELEVTLDRSAQKPVVQKSGERSVDDEMAKLLGELSNERR